METAQLEEAEGWAKEIADIYAHLKEEAINIEPEDALAELNYCNMMIARVSEILVKAEGIVRQAQGKEADALQRQLDELGIKVSQKNFDRAVEKATDTEMRFYALTERLSATLSKRITSLITAISFGKQTRVGNGR